MSALDPRVDSVSRAIRVRALVRNENAVLRPGLFAHVTHVLGRNNHALLIPEEAVLHRRDRSIVYRLVDHAAHETEVTLGARERGMVQVLSGLAAGDQVVRAGHEKLTDGVRVAAP